jgi:hypothetical protein
VVQPDLGRQPLEPACSHGRRARGVGLAVLGGDHGGAGAARERREPERGLAQGEGGEVSPERRYHESYSRSTGSDGTGTGRRRGGPRRPRRARVRALALGVARAARRLPAAPGRSSSTHGAAKEPRSPFFDQVPRRRRRARGGTAPRGDGEPAAQAPPGIGNRPATGGIGAGLAAGAVPSLESARGRATLAFMARAPARVEDGRMAPWGHPGSAAMAGGDRARAVDGARAGDGVRPQPPARGSVRQGRRRRR